MLVINARKILPSINNFAIGSGKIKSPLDIGTSYVDQIEKMSPKISGASSYNGSAIGYGSFQQKINNVGTTKNRATLEKNNGKLMLYAENIQTDPNLKLSFWLANTTTFSNQTEYVDFGPIKSGSGTQTYSIDLHGGDLDISVYKYLMIVDPKTYQIYAVASLGR